MRHILADFYHSVKEHTWLFSPYVLINKVWVYQELHQCSAKNYLPVIWKIEGLGQVSLDYLIENMDMFLLVYVYGGEHVHIKTNLENTLHKTTKRQNVTADDMAHLFLKLHFKVTRRKEDILCLRLHIDIYERIVIKR